MKPWQLLFYPCAFGVAYLVGDAARPRGPVALFAGCTLAALVGGLVYGWVERRMGEP